ncbi:hypothetical protein NEOLEDRAFT_1043160, partial [Neolentinus lepideus HHB14362 ss-1]
YRMQLNNFLQVNGGTQQMHMSASNNGPAHAPQWTVVVRINNIEYGTGVAPTLNEAKEAAAQQTLVQIRANGNR